MAFTSIGTFSWGSGPTITGTVYYDKQRSGADMQYKIKVEVNAVTGSSYFGYPIYLKINLAGSTIVTRTLKSATPSQWSSALTYEDSSWHTVSNKTSGTTALSVNLYSGSGSSRDTTYSYSLPVSAAMSTLSVANGTLGNAQTLTVTRYDTTFKHRISYACGNASGYIAGSSSSYSTASSVSWTPPISLAAQNTSGTSVSVKISITTYTSGGSVVGSYTYTVTMTVPASIKPSLTLTLSDDTGYYNTYGGYVKLRSRLKVVLNKTTSQGASIKSYRIEVGSDIYTTDGVTTPELQVGGDVTVKATITDTRGRTATATQSITVLAYQAPTILGMAAERCDSSGALKADGAFIKVTFSAVISAMSNRNTASYSVLYRESGSSEWTVGNLSTLTGVYTPTGAQAIIPAATNKAWDVAIRANDAFVSLDGAIVKVPVGFTMMDVRKDTKSIAMGKESTRAETFECAWDAEFDGDVHVGENLNIGGHSIFDLVYPIGSIYMSVNAVDPGTLFGGTWQRIKDRFLLSAGDTYAAGATGGAAEVTLTTNQMPSHNHTPSSSGHLFLSTNSSKAFSTGNCGNLSGTSRYYMYAASDYDVSRVNTNSVGGGAAHNNMPPYLAVYIWKRTA